MNRVVVYLLLLMSCVLMTEGRPSSPDTYADENSNYVSNEIHDDNILKDGARRMAKFLFGSRLGFPASPSSLSGPAKSKNFGLDMDAVSEGVLKPDNIAIHVIQNAVNFVSSSLAWFVIGGLTSVSGFSGRSAPSPSYNLAGQYNYNNHGKSLSNNEYNDFMKSFTDNYQTEPDNTLTKRHLYPYNGGSANDPRGKDNVYVIRKILRKVVNSSKNRN
ncbi:uncharacterized protein [Lepeophtheirus salmonis]|uniref:uncharacterized protein n=1 Tax=Lepeophtheirus salmonis TaxID=72036 RepID=UPI001AE67B02|nr:uncharacterized protein LOC121118416 [Lepeophtheirus salmonis]